MIKNIKITWNDQKGKSFEDLVYKLLICMFPDIVFKQTDYVHDGGKDFYSVGDINEETIWVEAKNYNEHLELSKFSNTFIMADISEINRIIIFSMSEITKGAKTNIARYAAYHKKKISVYAGSDVLLLLKKFSNDIEIESYIQNANSVLNKIEIEDILPQSTTVTYEYFHAKQFNLAYRRDKENYIKKREIDNLPLHSLIAQEIHITNNDLFAEKKVSLNYSKYENPFFEIYYHDAKMDYIVIPPASSCIIVIFFKIAEMCGKINLPTIDFEDSAINIENGTRQTECCWLGEIPYIGAGWGELQNTIYALNSNTDKKIVVIEGKSGVGKSRFLLELSGFLYQKGYRIVSIDFSSIVDLSLKNALQIILNNIYILDDTNGDDIICFEKFGEIYKDFFDILFNDSYDCTQHIDKICILLLSLFRKKQIVLLIDNVQDTGTETVKFFEHLVQMVNNQPDIQSFIVLSFNLDFLFREKASYRLQIYLKQLNSVHLVALSDFSREEAKVYLTECLDPRRIRPDLCAYFDEIVTNYGTNPFVLKQVILYLKQRGIISFLDSMIYISNFADMKIVLSELPKGINQILQYRYLHLLQNTKLEDSRSMNRIIWSILFFGQLKPNVISQLALDFQGINSLMNFGFTEYNENAEVVFCHQLIEKSFCLFFLGDKYIKNPVLTFIDDEEFLNNLFYVTDRIGKINLCIENMLLRTHLNRIDVENFELAMKRLITVSPRQIIIPLIIESLTTSLNNGVKVSASLEFQTLYSISAACQERFDVYTAAKYTKNLVEFEQQTYKKKLSASNEMLMFFKNYVFQLPITEKYSFLDWLLNEAIHFELSTDEYMGFLGWLHNRYSKNSCSEHKFQEAEIHAQKALRIALDQNDHLSAAQAEIEYGNIFAYSNIVETKKHWQNCVDYIAKCNTESTYFKIFQYGYSILNHILAKGDLKAILPELEMLLELREKTFLYQKLFIDDIYADYHIIQYVDGEVSFEDFKEILPKLNRMKLESYMHTPKFTILATYKLFTAYRLICIKEPTVENVDIAVSLVFELIKNNIFDDSKLEYSMMILYEIYVFCQMESGLFNKIYTELPDKAKTIFICMKDSKYKKKFEHAITTLTNKGSQVNLLYFNYLF